MKRITKRIFCGAAEKWCNHSYSVVYHELIVIDATNKFSEEECEDLFKAYLNGFLKLTLSEVRKKYKNLEFEESYKGDTVTVEITKRKRRLFWKKK